MVPNRLADRSPPTMPTYQSLQPDGGPENLNVLLNPALSWLQSLSGGRRSAPAGQARDVRRTKGKSRRMNSHEANLSTPSFETDRILVAGWHAPELQNAIDLPDFLVSLLTEAVTQPLPTDWHGPYTRTRAEARIDKCDREGGTSLVIRKRDREPIGLLFSYGATGDSKKPLDFRIGYVLSESVWGLGLATELVAGFINWCSARPVTSITGGVERNNAASMRVLQKNGFVRSGESEDSLIEFFTLTTAR